MSNETKKSEAEAPIVGRRAIAGGLLAALSASLLGAGCTAGSSPTLPIPPPLAESTSPSVDGLVTITGTGADPDAIMAAFNENTGLGVLGEPEPDGSFTLVLEGSVDDSISVWQQIGTRTSQIQTVLVPGG